MAGVSGASEDSEFVYFTGVQPGTYSIAVSYTGSTPVYNPPAERYAATAMPEDSATRGNWGRVYGKDGYVLCNYNGNHVDKKSLPAYVSAITYSIRGSNQPAATIWASGTSDSRNTTSSRVG